MTPQKLVTEAQILSRLKQRDWALPPLTVEKVETLFSAKDTGLDARITLGWKGRNYRFGAEVRRLWTPKVLSEAADSVLRSAAKQRLAPLIVVPFLGEERLRELESREISAIDLCGNGVVMVPGELLVFRSGAPNQFRSESKIKNVYRGTSAIVARTFLATPVFQSLGDVLDEIRSLGGEVTLSTVSKVCKSLEQDLVIERTPSNGALAKLRLLQPEKLLDLLRENYSEPSINGSLTGKFAGAANSLVDRLGALDKKGSTRVAITGAGSVEAYAVMAREPVQTFYCSNLAAVRRNLASDFTETDRFPNVRLLETEDDFVYYDRRPELVASPVQVYLELASGEKREKETADQVRRFILSKISAKEGKR